MTVYHEGMTENTWEYLNAERAARADARRWRDRRLAIYCAALALAFMLAALVTAAHAQADGSDEISSIVFCGGLAEIKGQRLENLHLSANCPDVLRVGSGSQVGTPRELDPSLSEPVPPGTSLRNYPRPIGVDGQAGAP